MTQTILAADMNASYTKLDQKNYTKNILQYNLSHACIILNLVLEYIFLMHTQKIFDSNSFTVVFQFLLI